jgi:hypothetical protein
MTNIGAIWARVSTLGQAETSLESQISRAEAKLIDAGYSVPKERILAVDWSSLDLFSCPKFQLLRKWVSNREVQAIGILDRDRLEAKGLQRLLFLSDCREAEVKLVICQGPPILDEPEGQLVELALAIGKERSVIRTRQGAKDGLHDRVNKSRLPTSRHRLYGYKWDGSLRLIPDENWTVVKLIFDMAFSGATYDVIIKELIKRGILSPGGLHDWPKATISAILHNPTYGGRYHALKKKSVEPLNRKRDTYGNSSQRQLPSEKWVYLHEVEVVNPPISWGRWGQLSKRLQENTRFSPRNSKANYLLRGLVFCDYHRGKKGEPRVYHGQPHRKSWRYACPVGGCPKASLNGPRLEELAKLHTRFLISLQPDEFYIHISGKYNIDALKESLTMEQRKLEAQYNRNINAETELENRSLQGQIHSEVYRRLKAKYQTERKWIEERKEVIRDQITQLNRQAEAVDSLMQIKADLGSRLDSLTKEEWRRLFRALNLEIHVRDGATITTWPEDWGHNIPKEVIGLEIYFSLQLNRDADKVADIMFKCPRAA